MRKEFDQSVPSRHLSPEEMEVLCGGGGVGQVHVDIVAIGTRLSAAAQLEEALHAARGMLRPRPIVAVGEEHHQTRLQEPLGCTVGGVE